MQIEIDGVGGMVQLNGNIYTITTVDADHFTLNGIDSTIYTPYTSGGTWEDIAMKEVASAGHDLSVGHHPDHSREAVRF